MCQIDNSTLSDSSSTTITGNAILTIANCGHPPPLLIGPDGEVRALEASVPASPLGVGSDPALDHIEVPPACTDPALHRWFGRCHGQLGERL